METVLRTLIALLAVVGLFEVIWQLCCLVSRKSVQCKKIRILLFPEERSDPDLLVNHLLRTTDRLCTGPDTEILLVCPEKGNDDFLRLTEERYSRVRRIKPEALCQEFSPSNKQLLSEDSAVFPLEKESHRD